MSKTDPTTRNLDEWLTKLRKLTQEQPTEDGAWSTEELAERLGVSAKGTLDIIKRGIRQGLVKVVRVYRPNILGQVRPTYAYRPVEKKP